MDPLEAVWSTQEKHAALSSGRKPDCSMRTFVPPFAGVSVQVKTVFSPPAASSPEAFQL
jgi:hypothetical protein